MPNRRFQLFSLIVIFTLVAMACSFTAPTPTRVANQVPIPQDTLAAPTVAPTASPAVTLAVPNTTAAPAAQAGGPQIITGKLSYTNAYFTSGVAEPEIILEDESGFVTRNRKFVIPIQSQVIGQITSDFYTSPFTYTLSLPAEPNGTLNDVAHDGNTSTGVMVFAVAYWTNIWGDPYLEVRDQGGGGWSSAYASTRVSSDRATYMEVFGGKYLVYAPDGKEKFPSGFGADKKLFTNDDPLMSIPAGWSVIDMDKTPFAIDRSEKPVIDLIEPPSAAKDDYSSLSYTDAFDKMIARFTTQYAWTDLKKIDWTAKSKQFRPLFEKAQAAKDPHAYALALRDFLWSIPDTHIGMDMSLLQKDYQTQTAGGLGFAMRDTDDGKIIANFILGGGPADKAGMKWGAQIISLDGKATGDVVSADVPWSSPFSKDDIKRLEQLRYALRFPLSKGTVSVTFINPGGSQQTASLPVVAERDSFDFSAPDAGSSPADLPVVYKVLPSGYGYIKINSFLDNEVLTIQIYERAIRYFKTNNVPGVILDMRTNGGGDGWLADQMAGYFFSTKTVVGNTAYYNKGSGAFYMDPSDSISMIPPSADLQYNGPVAVMVGPACASACEFFSYDMTINNRAMVVGQYSSEGAGGSVEQFSMPEGISVQMTIGRAVDANGNIHLEGKGVTPTVKVPVTADVLKQQANGVDVVLAAAENALKTTPPPGAGVKPSGPPTMASLTDAEKALSSGTALLEDRAREKYTAADLARPGTFTYTIPLSASEPLGWVYSWCAKDTATLDQNFKSIQVKFTLDGSDVTNQVYTADASSGGQQCRLVFTVLTIWPAGEHHLTTDVTFTAKINDGTSDYAAGDYKMEYTVDVKP